MKSFDYIIKDEIGLHARPAGMLVNETKKYESSVFISLGEKKADARRLMAVMGMGVKNGDKLHVEVEGNDENKACEGIKSFFESNL